MNSLIQCAAYQINLYNTYTTSGIATVIGTTALSFQKCTISRHGPPGFCQMADADAISAFFLF